MIPVQGPCATAITRLLEGQLARPLWLLREQNQQAQLGVLLSEALKHAGQPGSTHAQLVPVGSSTATSAGEVFRVQQELKVGAEKDRSDLVLLRAPDPNHPITLRRAKNGHLDVLAAVELADVAAVIEIKAACSADPEQRHFFRQDVRKLQGLLNAGKAAIPSCEFHFVLIDKSLPMGPHCHASVAPIPGWHRGHPFKIRVGKGPLRRDEPSPQLTLAPPLANPLGSIHVWQLGLVAGTLQPVVKRAI